MLCSLVATWALSMLLQWDENAQPHHAPIPLRAFEHGLEEQSDKQTSRLRAALQSSRPSTRGDEQSDPR
jgi:hypothetical protein